MNTHYRPGLLTKERKKIKDADSEQQTPDNAMPQTRQEAAEKYTQQIYTSLQDRRMAAERNTCNWEFVTNDQNNTSPIPMSNKDKMATTPQSCSKQDPNSEETEMQQRQENPADFVVSEMFETLRQENHKLKQQRNTLRDAIILLATHTTTAD